jgi:biotin operon repressor
MRVKAKEMMKKALTILREEEYTPAKVMGEKLHLSESAVYRLIRLFRADGVGIHTTPKGYILSEFARKPDDVHFLRRLNGRRASDFIALRAAEPDIRHRWSSVEDRRDLKLITAPLHVDLEDVTRGMKILLDTKNELKI